MVKLVDAFIEVHGRAPTMKEVDSMAALQQDSKKLDDLKRRVAYKKARRKPQGKYKKKGSLRRAPRNAMIINRMLMREISMREIGFYLHLSDGAVNDYISEWGLPRDLG